MANTTPNRNSRLKLSCKTKRPEQDKHVEEATTPIRSRQPLENDKDYSPMFLMLTQESQNGDVGWDWDSPQSKTNYARKPKRTQKVHSPKFPIKKQPIQTFDKVKEELKAFRYQVLESSTKVDYKDVLQLDDNDLEVATKCDNQFSDLFNDDSMENHLVKLSKEIEANIDKIDLNKAKASPRNMFTKSFSSDFLGNSFNESPIKKQVAHKAPFNFKSKLHELNEPIANDSFDKVLEAFIDIDYDLLTQVTENKPSDMTNVKKEFAAPLQPKKESPTSTSTTQKVPEFTLPLCKKAPVVASTNSLLKMKTKSFSFGDHYNTTISSQSQRIIDAKVLEEIEKKRLQALAKLHAKKKFIDLSDSDTSPIKCSPEEIELKRQQALAKRDAKKKQDIIERNRQEALKRLEINRKKRAASSQATRQ